MTLNIATLLRESAQRRGDAPALIEDDLTLGYRDLHDRVRRLAAGLAALGVRRGQHVALLLPNVPQFTLAYYACHYLGAPAVPLNALLAPEEVHHHLEDSEAVALIAWEDYLRTARDAVGLAPGCRHLVLAVRDGETDTHEGLPTVGGMVRRHEPVADLPDTMPDDTAVLLYTSGTTGKPKGAELTHFNLWWNASYMARHFMPGGGETVTLGALPLFHSFGQTVIQNATLAAGGTLVLLPRFTPAAALGAIERHRISFFAGVPTMYYTMLHHDGFEGRNLGSLTTCISGGAPMPLEVMRAFEQRCPVPILEGYGLSETSPVAAQTPREGPRKPGSIGLPLRGVEFRLIDDQGNAMTDGGALGEIAIRGPIIMKGYFRNPDATAEAIRGGWFRTGDVARRDEDGYYFIVDRKKDVVLRGGYTVYPREVEEVLYAHPAVAEAAAIGVPDERLGEEVEAVVALRVGRAASADDLIGWCRERLAAYKYPRRIRFVDALPKGPTGKVLKRELRTP